MIVSIIVARSSNNVIGVNNDLAWHLPEDMKFFKNTTLGHIVVMGRKNWESIPKKYRPLPKRTNVVLTRQKGFSAEGAKVFHNYKDPIEFAKEQGEHELFIIGGAEIYKLYLEHNLIDRMYITEVDAKFEGDTYFPKFDESSWKLTSERKFNRDRKNNFNMKFMVLEKH